jgi:hypothetical protein
MLVFIPSLLNALTPLPVSPNSFNGFAVWLPDLYNRLALYTEQNPDHSLTMCEAVAALASSTEVADAFVRPIEIQNQTQLMGANSTNATSDLSNAAACSSSVNPTVFRNSLAVGVVCIIVYTSAGYLVNFTKKKPLMGKLSDGCLCTSLTRS